MSVVPDITAGTGTESDETPGWWWPVGLSQWEGAHERVVSVDGALFRVPGHLGVGRPSIYTTASLTGNPAPSGSGRHSARLLTSWRGLHRGTVGLIMAYAVIMLSLWTPLMQAATPAESAVSLVFKQADAGLAHFALLQRTGVTGELDLVVMIGSPKTLRIDQTPWTWWSEERK